jgi:DNA-binding LacI/PurR family transcriptional regulator
MREIKFEKLTKYRLAIALGISRPTLDAWVSNPDKMTLGAYKKLKALGLELGGDITTVVHCDKCNGLGYLIAPSQPEGKQP